MLDILLNLLSYAWWLLVAVSLLAILVRCAGDEG